ncbi:MAG TPA: efflux RND transporter periplasmic adaptor subunit [Epsilonproteobacteria bacterium]|nr:efflux RND transporter periplasmic adaptor subunit [Campylobacterota bacterium]
MMGLLRLFIVSMLVISYSLSSELVLSGSVVSDNQKVLTSRNMGYVKEMLVSEGDLVKKGQLLYVIDPIEVNAAEQMNQNQLDNIMTNLVRHERLYAKGMVSKYDLENLRLAAKNQKQMLAISKAQDKYLRVTAPNDGIIVAKHLNEGEMATPGMPALVLTDLDKLKIVIEIGESDLSLFEVGTPLKVQVPSVNFETKGSVSAIIPASNPMTHKFRAKVSFDKGEKMIYPGMFARIVLERESK